MCVCICPYFFWHPLVSKSSHSNIFNDPSKVDPVNFSKPSEFWVAPSRKASFHFLRSIDHATCIICRSGHHGPTVECMNSVAFQF